MNRNARLVVLALAGIAASTLQQSATAQVRTTLPAPKANHGFLYIPGVAGAVTTGKYRNWHAVDGFGLEAQRIVRSGRGAGTTLSPLSVGADLGVGLPRLLVKCASGQRLSFVILRMHRANEARYFAEIRLYNVTILSVSSAENLGGGGQSIEFDYTRMTLTQVDTTTGTRTSRTINRATRSFGRGKSVTVAGSDANDYDVYVRVDGIAGTSRRSGYAGWHEIDSYGIGVRRSSAYAATFSPLRLKSKLSALPEFTMAALTGQRIRTVEVHVWSKKITRGPVLVMTLSDAFVIRATSSADGKASGQILELKYRRVQFEYFKGGRGSRQGSTRGGWNLSTNTAM